VFKIVVKISHGGRISSFRHIFAVTMLASSSATDVNTINYRQLLSIQFKLSDANSRRMYF